jgi:DNA-nicking Smr family endonuclease
MGCCGGKHEQEDEGSEFQPIACNHTATLPCEPSMVGGVIGPQGAVIKDLEAQSGARLRVDQTLKDRPRIVIAGSLQSVQKACALCANLLRTLDNPDYEGATGHQLRKVAEQWGRKIHELFDQAHAAHEAHDGAKAKALSTQGHAAQAERDKANKAAAAAIFKHRNPGGTKSMRCDLHGLHKDEALAALGSFFSQVGAKCGGLRILIVIPGAGHHSQGHKAVLKPAVHEVCCQCNQYALTAVSALTVVQW